MSEIVQENPQIIDDVYVYYKDYKDMKEYEERLYKSLQEVTCKRIDRDKKEIERLNKCIDKAIEYIENGCEGHDYYEYDYIVNILQGSDSNENNM